MFKFKFSNESESTDEEDEGDKLHWYECRKLEITAEMKESVRDLKEDGCIRLNYEGNLSLTCLSPTHVLNSLRNGTGGGDFSDAVEADKNHSDLIPGKYEGGLKIWECTRDLVNYFVQNARTDSLDGKRVLDLGCGSGVLGIASLLKGAFVTFQDYNCEVLQLTTIPNVYLNMRCMEAFDRSEFFSGDWESFADVLHAQNGEKGCGESAAKKPKISPPCNKFDFILSSETIYNPRNYRKLCLVIKRLMKCDGVCYVAAKTCYFGVGGSTQDFANHIRKESVFDAETCWFSSEGVAREIIRITFKKEPTAD